MTFLRHREGPAPVAEERDEIVIVVVVPCTMAHNTLLGRRRMKDGQAVAVDLIIIAIANMVDIILSHIIITSNPPLGVIIVVKETVQIEREVKETIAVRGIKTGTTILT